MPIREKIKHVSTSLRHRKPRFPRLFSTLRILHRIYFLIFSLVSIYIFSKNYVRPQVRKRQRASRMYKYLCKNLSEASSARRTAQKHGRENRNGVFQVGAGNVKQSCFAYALLVGKSFLQKDERYKVLDTNRNADLTELYTTDEITNVYETAGVCVGPVRIEQCRLFYEIYLLQDKINLVVFSRSQQDNADGILHRITNDVIFLWLNDAHYDLILSPKTFSRFNLTQICFKCMRYYKNLKIINRTCVKPNSVVKIVTLMTTCMLKKIILKWNVANAMFCSTIELVFIHI